MSSNKEVSQIVSIYIPRLLCNINQQKIKNTFHSLNIGKVFYIDMYKRVNENNNHYYFAFLSLKLYDTGYAKSFYKKLISSDKIRLIYNECKQLYWEVKLHKEKKMRTKELPLYLIEDVEDYKKGLEEDYNELIKEIFHITLQL
jgi:hypothetical protein